MLFRKQRRGPLTTLTRRDAERKMALTTALAPLPTSWREVALRAEWYATSAAPAAVRRTIARDGEAIVFVNSLERWHVYTDALEPESLLRLAMLAVIRQIAMPETVLDPIKAVMAIARRTGATLDADGITNRYRSMATPATFAAVLLSQTLTELDYDPAHPLLHPASEQLWPGSSDMIAAAERILTMRCEALLNGHEVPSNSAFDTFDDFEDEEDDI